MAKKIPLGIPKEPPMGAAENLGAVLGGPETAGPPPPGDGGGGPPPGDGGGGGGPPGGDGGAQENMDYPELNIGGLGPESGIGDLPDEGEAHIGYKVTGRGQHTVKHGKHKGKTHHHVSMDVHHITPTGSKGGKKSEDDHIRDKARNYFAAQDRSVKTPAAESESPNSEMPG